MRANWFGLLTTVNLWALNGFSYVFFRILLGLRYESANSGKVRFRTAELEARPWESGAWVWNSHLFKHPGWPGGLVS